MFDQSSHTYLRNSDLITTLEQIKADVLHNKKIDILAFDTCMGAMIEVAYQVSSFVEFMVGCQSCALTDGFEYKGIMELLKNQCCTPRDIAIGMVNIFDRYYHANDDEGIYSHSAFELRYMDELHRAMNTVITLLLEMPEGLEILEKAGKNSPRLCMWPMYTDMIEFFLLCQKYAQNNDIFNDALNQLIDVHSKMVVAYCAGFSIGDIVHGSAIYCPFAHIESSYYDTAFAQSFRWLKLLELMCKTELPSDSTFPYWTVGEL